MRAWGSLSLVRRARNRRPNSCGARPFPARSADETPGRHAVPTGPGTARLGRARIPHPICGALSLGMVVAIAVATSAAMAAEAGEEEEAPTTREAPPTTRAAARYQPVIEVSRSLLVRPEGLGILAAWLLACLYCTTWSQRRLPLGAERRVAVNWLLLLTGPIGLAGLLVAERSPAVRRGLEGFVGLFGRSGPQAAPEPVESLPIALCTSDGAPVGTTMGRKLASGDTLETAKRIVHEGIQRRASDILIDPRSGDVYLVRYRVDGILQEVARFQAEQGMAIVNCFKVASRLDISEKRRPQDGAFIAKLPDREIKFRTATAGTLYGEKIAIRIFDSQTGLKGLDHLGLTEDQKPQIARFVERSDGMLLIAGPTGSGKTTTIYGALNLLAGQGRNIVTIEDPIEYPIPHASQTEVNTKAGVTFATQLRSILRQDPDVILVGEIRDGETAETALQASQTGHLVLSTIHSNDGLTALARLVEFGIEPFLISTGLTAVLSQRLVRVLCPACKKPAKISQRLRRHAAHRQIALGNVSVAVGCDVCNGTGYMGRTGIFEVFWLSREMGQLLTSRPSLATIQTQAQKEGLITMRQRGIEKVLQGVSTVEEVNRVTT
jgi:general secretion pathway protein E